MATKYKVYITLIGILIISITLILVNVSKRTYTINLEGANPLKIVEGSTFVEPGYEAYDNLERDTTSMVKVEGEVNANVAGNYEITYSIDNKYEVKRHVIVSEVIPDDLKVKFNLIGNSKITLKRGNQYQELGFTAIGDNERDYSKYVVVEGIVDTNKVGIYNLTYNLNVGNVSKTLKRVVEVVGEKYTVKFDNEMPTNKGVIINVQNNLKDFAYFTDKDGNKLKGEQISYKVTENGIYTFYMYDSKGNREKIQTEVTNIDKKKPTATCQASVSDKVTSYLVEAYDESGISRYVHGNSTFYTSEFSVKNDPESDEVLVYDMAGNSLAITCNYAPIPKNDSDIIAIYESPTLKYWIEKSNYYTVTHIWMEDVYNQMKTAINTKIGVLETGKTILTNEIKKQNYSNKALIAIDASGFLMTKDDPHIAYNAAWASSSRAPVIIVDGKIKRNFATGNLPDNLYPIYGLKKNGYLSYFNLEGGKDKIESNLKTIDNALEEGIRYTFSFNPILVLNHEVQSNLTSKNIRQGLCQIDRNNFVVITNTNPTTNRTVGFSLKGLAEYMVSLNCRIGFNLDGGGSVNLFYKENNSTIKTIKSSTRKIADILYFVE